MFSPIALRKCIFNWPQYAYIYFPRNIFAFIFAIFMYFILLFWILRIFRLSSFSFPFPSFYLPFFIFIDIHTKSFDSVKVYKMKINVHPSLENWFLVADAIVEFKIVHSSVNLTYKTITLCFEEVRARTKAAWGTKF